MPEELLISKRRVKADCDLCRAEDVECHIAFYVGERILLLCGECLYRLTHFFNFRVKEVAKPIEREGEA